VLRLPVVKEATGVGRTFILDGVKKGTFPAPIRLGPRAVGWLESDVQKWIAEQAKKREAAQQRPTKADRELHAACRQLERDLGNILGPVLTARPRRTKKTGGGQ
jgi:prophage regulatory protein